MILYLMALLLGMIFGYYMGNRRFRRSISRMINTMRRHDYDEDED